MNHDDTTRQEDSLWEDGVFRNPTRKRGMNRQSSVPLAYASGYEELLLTYCKNSE